ncbi:putative Integrin alpha-PS4 [Hypsibius exemplaris]|uniref:Integrin alpha-PS4 n=1 Tax=Hypsibius exemplaris TaxID=2072580 RepID=A0A1W0WVC8_HYPEX|nr:putative Integrin alpha-PS4 [Hypsibius exemplaris]
MCKEYVLIAILTLSSIHSISFCQTLNLDKDNVVIIKKPTQLRNVIENNTLFGFSLAFYNQTTGRKSENGLLIGAPNATDRRTSREIRRPGVLYFCPFTDGNDRRSGSNCRAINVDADINVTCAKSTCKKFEETYPLYKYKPYRSDSLLGFTVVTQSEDPKQAMVCAPKWTNRNGSQDVYNVNGMCYLAPMNGKTVGRDGWMKVMSFNVEGAQWASGGKVMFLGRAQAGIAAAILPGENGALISAPGYWNGLGTIAHTPFTKKRDYSLLPPIETVILASKNHTKYCEDEGSRYLGFSVAAGKLLGPTGELHFVSGMPRANSTGMVVVYNRSRSFNDTRNITGRLTRLNENMNPLFYLEGDGQFGESFGYSVLVLDLNGDGSDDIVVGAPFYQDPVSGNATGAVYGFISSNKWNQSVSVGQDLIIKPSFRIIGTDGAHSRFGITLAKLGDLNSDGFQDFAVGAPFGSSGGAVHVIYGAETGYAVPLQPRILSPDKSQGFGWAIAEGNDVDSNFVNDLAVGDFLSEKVYIFRGQPVMTWGFNITSNVTELLVQAHNQTISITACLIVQTNSPSPGRLKILPTLLIEPSVENSTRRAAFVETGTNEISRSEVFLHINGTPQQHCITERVVVYGQPGANITPLRIEMHPKYISPRKSGVFCSDCFAQSLNSPTQGEILVPFVFCLRDNDNCKFQIDIESSGSHDAGLNIIQGSNSPVVMRYNITNRRESFPLYSPSINVSLPEGLSLLRIDTGNENRTDILINFTDTGSRPEGRLYTARVPQWQGPTEPLMPNQTFFVDLHINVSGIEFDQAVNSQRTNTILSMIIGHEALANIKPMSRAMRLSTTLFKLVSSFSVQITPSFQDVTSDVKLEVVNNDVTIPSETTFNLDFEVASVGAGTVPSGLKLILEIPISIADRTYFTDPVIKILNSNVHKQLNCSWTTEPLKEDLIRSTEVHNLDIETDLLITDVNNGTAKRSKTENSSSKIVLSCKTNGTVCRSMGCDLPSIPRHLRLNLTVAMTIIPEILKFNEQTQGLLEVSLELMAKLGARDYIKDPRNVTVNSKTHVLDLSDSALQQTQLTRRITIYYRNDKFPVWAIVVGVCSALLILLLLALVLWRVGFYKRRQLEDEERLATADSVLHVADDDDDEGDMQGGFMVDRDFQKQSLRSSTESNLDEADISPIRSKL